MYLNSCQYLMSEHLVRNIEKPSPPFSDDSEGSLVFLCPYPVYIIIKFECESKVLSGFSSNKIKKYPHDHADQMKCISIIWQK